MISIQDGLKFEFTRVLNGNCPTLWRGVVNDGQILFYEIQTTVYNGRIQERVASKTCLNLTCRIGNQETIKRQIDKQKHQTRLINFMRDDLRFR